MEVPNEAMSAVDGVMGNPLTPTPPPAATSAAAIAPDAQSAVDGVMHGDTSSQIKINASAAAGTSPDQEAMHRQIASQTGIPLSSVQAQPDLAKQQAAATLIDADGIAQNTPATAKFLTDASNMKVASDDINNLQAVEKSVVPPTAGNIGKGLLTDLVLGMVKTVAGSNAFITDELGLPESVTQHSLDTIRGADKAIEQNTPTFDSTLGKWTYGGASGMVSMLPIIAAALYSGPLAGAAMFGTQGAAQGYGKYRARGATPDQATTGGMIEGAIMAGTSFLPLNYLTSKLGKAGAGDFLANLIGRDVVAMNVQGLSMGAVDTAIANPTKTWTDYVKDIPGTVGQSTVAGLMFGGVFGAVNAVAKIASRDEVKAQTAQQGADFLKSLSDASAASKLRLRDPDAFNAFVKQAAEGGPVQDVYLNPNTLAQEKIDTAELVKAMPDMQDKLATAQATGTDIKIPVQDFATKLAGTDFGAAVLDHLKTDPEGMSKAESEHFFQTQGPELQAQVDKILEQKKGDDVFKASSDAVHENIMGQLKAANRFTDDVNKPYASLISNFYAVQAARTGVTPEELFAKYPLNIVRSLDEGRVLNQNKEDSNLLDTGFYSKMRNHVDEKFNGTGTAKQFLDQAEAAVKNGAFKKDEFFWSGLEEHLKDRIAQPAKDLAAAKDDVADLQAMIRSSEEDLKTAQPEDKDFVTNRLNTRKERLAEAEAALAKAEKDNTNPPKISKKDILDWIDKNRDNLKEHVFSLTKSQVKVPITKRGVSESGFDRSQFPTAEDIDWASVEQRQPSQDDINSELEWLTESFKDSEDPEAWFKDNNHGDLVTATHLDENDEPTDKTEYEWDDAKVEEYQRDDAERSAWERAGYEMNGTVGGHEYSAYFEPESDYASISHTGPDGQTRELPTPTGRVVNEENVRALIENDMYEQGIIHHESDVDDKELEYEEKQKQEEEDRIARALRGTVGEHDQGTEGESVPAGMAEDLLRQGENGVRVVSQFENVPFYTEFDIPYLQELLKQGSFGDRKIIPFKNDSRPLGVDEETARAALKKGYKVFLVGDEDTSENEERDGFARVRAGERRQLTDDSVHTPNPPDPIDKSMLKAIDAGMAHLVMYPKTAEVEGVDFRYQTKTTGKLNWETYKEKGPVGDQHEIVVQVPKIPDAGVSQHSWSGAKNVLMHIRFNERQTEGGKTLFIEEIQSDWHQQGEEKGYDTPERQEQRADLERRIKELERRSDELAADRLPNNMMRDEKEWHSITGRKEELKEQLRAAEKAVPPAPFDALNKYTELAMKRMILWAVHNGYDHVAWTTGEQQAARWSGALQREVSKIHVAHKDADTVTIGVYTPSGQNVSKFLSENTKGGKYVEIPGGNDQITLPRSEAATLFGKSILDAIDETEDGQSITGQNLKINSKGMLEVYNKVMVNTANNLIKKFDSKVTPMKVDTGASQPTHQWSFPITDKMKASVGEVGLPLYQGNRGAFNPETSTISLLKAADLSTFLHESGHFFLETMNKMAQEANAPDGIKQDMQTTLDWLGVKDLAEWNSKTLEQQRNQHETFARGFEAYLFEGKSPSIEMAGVFGRFRAWLLNVYQSLAKLNVELSPEIRGVFDRMLATTEQIKQAEDARNFTALFTKPEDAQMSQEEFKAYHDLGVEATQDAITALQARSMRDMKWASDAKAGVLKKMQKNAEEKRKSVGKEVSKEVYAEPINKARAFIKRGEIDGKKVDGPHRLDLDAVKEKIAIQRGAGGAAANLDDLQSKFGAYGVLGRDGIHPDTAAEMFGFSSGDELIKQLIEAENPVDKIAGMTDQRMLERYGDLNSPEAIDKAADEAVHNKVRTRFVATELSALDKAVGNKKLLAAQAKMFVENMISRMSVREAVLPGRFLAAETRAGKEAMKALKAGDLPAAAKAKRDQLVNSLAAVAAYEAQNEVDKIQRNAKRYDRKSVRERIGTDIALIDNLFDKYDLRKNPVEKEDQKIISLRTWYDAQREAGYEPSIDERLMIERDRTHYKDLSMEALRGLDAAARSIEKVARSRKEITRDGKKIALENVVKELLVPMQERGDKFTKAELIEAPAKGTDSVMSRVLHALGSKLRLAGTDLKMPDYKRNYYDLHELAGPFGKNIFDPIFDRNYWKIDNLKSMSDDFKAKVDALGEDWQKSLTDLVTNNVLSDPDLAEPGAPATLKVTRARLLGMARHFGNESNFAKLYKGYGWKPEELWKFVMDNMRENDWKAVNAEWETFERYWPESEAMIRRLGGVVPDKIPLRPFKTPFGEMKGGYAPIDYDPIRSKLSAKFGEPVADATTSLAKPQNYKATTTFNGSMNNRAEGYTDRMNLDYHYVTRRLHETIHDLAYREVLIDSRKIISDPKFRDQFMRSYGREEYSGLVKFIDNIANMLTRDTQMNNFERAMQYARQGITMTGIGYRLTTVLKHGGSAAFKSFGQVGGSGRKYLLARIARMSTGNLNDDIKDATQKFPEIRARLLQMDRDYKVGGNSLYEPEDWRAKNDRYGHALIAWSDALSAIPTAHAAYDWATSEGVPKSLGGTGEPLSHEAAVQFANKMVREAHGTANETARANFLHDRGIKSLFGTIYAFQNNTFGQLGDMIDKTVVGGKFKNRPEILARAMAQMIMPGVLTYWLSNGKDDKESWGSWMAKAITGEIASTVPGVRDAWNMIEGKMAGADRALQVPAASMITDLGKVGEDIYKELHHKDVKIIQDSLKALGEWAHIGGLGQAGKTLQYIHDAHTGKEHPKTALEAVQGATIGVHKPK